MDTWKDQNAEDSNPQHLAVLDTYQEELDSWSPIAQVLLESDLDALAEELGRGDPSQALDRAWAALELRRRIGGSQNLRAYVKCMVAQAYRQLRAGQWQAPVPPGPTDAWGEDAWVRYICQTGSWGTPPPYRTTDAFYVYAWGEAPDTSDLDQEDR